MHTIEGNSLICIVQESPDEDISDEKRKLLLKGYVQIDQKSFWGEIWNYYTPKELAAVKYENNMARPQERV